MRVLQDQVHRARLADGRSVAVKVLRSGTGTQVEADLALLAMLARRLAHLSGTTLGVRPATVGAELVSRGLDADRLLAVGTVAMLRQILRRWYRNRPENMLVDLDGTPHRAPGRLVRSQARTGPPARTHARSG